MPDKQTHDLDTNDIVIAGGGLTGLMMAITLAHTPYAVTLIDRSSGGARPDTPEPASTKPRDRRTTTIHAAGARMLDCLGVWEYLTDKAAPIWHMPVSYTHLTLPTILLV